MTSTLLRRRGSPIADGDVRLDTGVVTGDSIRVYYDQLTAKPIPWGGHRPDAITTLEGALGRAAALGVHKDAEILQQLAYQPDFIQG